MTISKNQNIVLRFFESIFHELTKDEKPKERAVRIWDIITFVQNQLDQQAGTNEYGEPMRTAYVMDAYIDNTGTFAIITRDDGKLYKIPVFVDDQSQMSMGEEQEVFMEFSPVTRQSEKSIMRVRRQADGTIRWFAMPACTAFLNRSGEIDSRALFDSFVEFAQRSNDFPELDFYHLGDRLTLGRADLLFRDGVNLCASGTFYDSDVARAAAKSIEDDGAYWGTSIAYLPTQEPEIIRSNEGVEIPVFNNGICRFISLLPEDTAASILTSISTRKEVNRMNDQQKAALKKLLGEDESLFNEIEQGLKENNRAADQPGVVSRQQTPTVAQAKPAEAPASPATPVAPVQQVTRGISADDLKAIFGSDEFKTAISSAFTEMRKAETAAADAATESETPAVAEGETESRSMEQKIDALLERMEALSRDQESDVQTILADLPARIAQARIIRPRAQFMPDDLMTKERRALPMAEIAAQTLAKISAE